MTKISALLALEQEMIRDKNLPLRESNLVFGEGSSNSEILFIGEAPGVQEDLQKRPFVGRSGQLLRKTIMELGWEENDVYITNIVKRRPPGNRDPSPDEISAYEPYLKKQINIIDPTIIVTLGRYAMNFFIPSLKITRDQGKIFRLSKKCLVPILHPAAALRSPEMATQFKETFFRLPKLIEVCKKSISEIQNLSEKKKGNPSQEKLF